MPYNPTRFCPAGFTILAHDVWWPGTQAAVVSIFSLSANGQTICHATSPEGDDTNVTFQYTDAQSFGNVASQIAYVQSQIEAANLPR